MIDAQGHYKHPKKRSRNIKGGMMPVQKLYGSSVYSD